MSAAHTPGPWIVRNIPTADIYIGPANDGGGPSVAIVGQRVNVSKSAQMANARLIASAPDLLDALKSAAVVMDDFSMMSPLLAAAVDQARAAIAKATGPAP